MTQPAVGTFTNPMRGFPASEESLQQLDGRTASIDTDTSLSDAVSITVPGTKKRRVPIADKQQYDIREFYVGTAQPADMLGYLQDMSHKSAISGGVGKIPEGYWELSGPYVPEQNAQIVGVGTFESTVLRGGAILRGYGPALSQIPATNALGGGESWLALKSGSNCPILLHDFDNSHGKRGPAWGNSYAIHGALRGIVLDVNGRNQTAQRAVDLTDAAFYSFDDVRLVNPRGNGFWLPNCNDVHGDGVYGIGLEDAVANGVGDLASSTTILNASGVWVKGDPISGIGIVAGTIIRSVVGSTLTISIAATLTAGATPLFKSVAIAENFLAFVNNTTDCWWVKCSMHDVNSESVLFATGGGAGGARGNVVQGFFGYGRGPGACNARFIEGAAHNQLYGRLDQARGHNARLDSTTHDNTLWVDAFGAGVWNTTADADGGWVAVFDDGKSNTVHGSGDPASDWVIASFDSGQIGIHRFGPNASGHGVDGMGGGSTLPTGSEKHRNLAAADGAGKSCVMPGPQPWAIDGTLFKPVSGSAAVVAPHVGNARYNVLKFDRAIEQAAGYQFQVPRGMTGLVISFDVLNQDAAQTGTTFWDVEYSGWPSGGGNSPGAAEQSWFTNPGGGAFFGKVIGANIQTHAVIHPVRITSMFTTVPGETAAVHIRRKAADVGDTLNAEVGLFVVRFEPVMLAP